MAPPSAACKTCGDGTTVLPALGPKRRDFRVPPGPLSGLLPWPLPGSRPRFDGVDCPLGAARPSTAGGFLGNFGRGTEHAEAGGARARRRAVGGAGWNVVGGAGERGLLEGRRGAVRLRGQPR